MVGILSCHARIFSLYSVVNGKTTEVFDSRRKIRVLFLKREQHEDPTCRRATKPCTTTTEPVL